MNKPFLWTEGRVCLRASLDKSAYGHGEHINVSVHVKNDSRKIIRKIRVSIRTQPRTAQAQRSSYKVHLIS